MSKSNRGKILYIGGFELPDKNAAAQRVVGIAKSLRELGYDVCFIHTPKDYDGDQRWTEYYGFKTLEYKRETEKDYLFCAHKILDIIKKEKPIIVIAYNYPAVALDRIRNYCKRNEIKCIADVTEWSLPVGGSIFYRLIKKFDTFYRMRYVHKKIDSVIAISRYLYEYYKPYVLSVLVPPTIDITDNKWNCEYAEPNEKMTLVYAGSPSALKERLDLIIRAVEENINDHQILLKVVGITKEQFIRMYRWKEFISDEIVFLGRKSHNEAINIIMHSSWSVIIRDNNLVVKAGFPTKLVESISCGTPVIANTFSNIMDYIDNNNSIIINDYSDLRKAISIACEKSVKVDRELFDYTRYTNVLRIVVE